MKSLVVFHMSPVWTGVILLQMSQINFNENSYRKLNFQSCIWCLHWCNNFMVSPKNFCRVLTLSWSNDHSFWILTNEGWVGGGGCRVFKAKANISYVSDYFQLQWLNVYCKCCKLINLYLSGFFFIKALFLSNKRMVHFHYVVLYKILLDVSCMFFVLLHHYTYGEVILYSL